ncbi:MAG TPA: hypothetical protein VFG69_15915 [Nannocystaceae bacterium]|nr:hypothetical protein [Nannocystaceae bacterium]
MDNVKELRLALGLGMVLGACAADEGGSHDEGTVTNPASGDPSGDPGVDDGEDDESGGPDADDSNAGDDGSTSDAPEPGTSASAGDDVGDDESSGGETPGDPDTGVRGAVIRSVAPAIGQDAIGTLYVGLLVECTADSAQAGGATPVENADLSADGSQVLYEVTGVAPGTYYMVAFLDDNLNADPANPYADNADLVTAEGFAPGCVEVTIVDGQMVNAPAPIDLNLVYPL